MSGKGIRRVLEPALYIGVALLLHAFLFLIPTGTGTKRGEATVRGMRIRTVGETRKSPSPPVPASTAEPVRPARIPDHPMGTAPGSPSAGVSSGGGGDTGGGNGTGAASTGVVGGAEGSPPIGEYGEFLARLRSEGVQGWARDSAGRLRQGWKGSGKGGKGLGIGAGGGEGGSGGRGSGGGSGGGAGSGYLDPRVKVVVTSYPPTGIEKRFTRIPYPDRKVKKHQFTSGWWNVFVQIRTDAAGNVVQRNVLRPETDGPLERIFVEQVGREIDKWSFDRKAAEINIDVRFYVE